MGKPPFISTKIRVRSTCPSLFQLLFSLPASCPAWQGAGRGGWFLTASSQVGRGQGREGSTGSRSPTVSAAPAALCSAAVIPSGASEQKALLNNSLFHLSCDHTQRLSVATAENKVTCTLCNATDRTGSRKEKKISLNHAVSLLPTCHLW